MEAAAFLLNFGAPKAAKAADPSRVPIGEAMAPGYEQYMPNWDHKRRFGVLLHPTCLPGDYGIGELGSECYRFLDWLESAGCRCWQVLPLVPPDSQFYSPYSGTDSNCGNPLLISLEELIMAGLLDAADRPAVVANTSKVDFQQVADTKTPLLRKAAQRLLSSPDAGKFSALKAGLRDFRSKHPWVEDSAQFDVLRNMPVLNTQAWWDWPVEYRDRVPEAMTEFKEKHKQDLDEFIATQFLFDTQWLAIKVRAWRMRPASSLPACGAAGACVHGPCACIITAVGDRGGGAWSVALNT